MVKSLDEKLKGRIKGDGYRSSIHPPAVRNAKRDGHWPLQEDKPAGCIILPPREILPGRRLLATVGLGLWPPCWCRSQVATSTRRAVLRHWRARQACHLHRHRRRRCPLIVRHRHASRTDIHRQQKDPGQADDRDLSWAVSKPPHDCVSKNTCVRCGLAWAGASIGRPPVPRTWKATVP